jgi:hypothetical protein
MEWISCADSMPADETRVLYVVGMWPWPRLGQTSQSLAHNLVRAGSYEGGGFYDDADDDFEPVPVSHWMPLPMPPGGK